VRARRGSGKRRSRAALNGGGENSAAQRQSGRWWLAPAQAAGDRRGLDLAQEGEETDRERKGGAGAVTPILTGSAAWSKGRGAARGGTTR
jgi:hypothetical protein